MSIQLLQKVAQQRLPVNIADLDEIDELLVLRSAGLIAAWSVRPQLEIGIAGQRLIRVLAITPQGRRLLHRMHSVAAATDAGG